jgi:hypothetical protein
MGAKARLLAPGAAAVGLKEAAGTGAVLGAGALALAGAGVPCLGAGRRTGA